MIPRIVVEDVGADAVLVEVNGEPVLVLSPRQSFASAVSAVERYVPELDQDRARALVRAHLPDAPDLEFAGETPSAPPADRGERRWLPAKVAVVAAAVAAAGGIVLGQLGNQASPSAAQTELRSASSPFDSENFRRLAAEGDLMCTPIGPLQARCTDWDGSVMLAEASVGPQKLTVTFSYGKERIGVGVFASVAEARAWLAEPATREMYPSARAQDRFVIWGTDSEKIASYLARIGDAADPRQGPVSKFLDGPAMPPMRAPARATLQGMLMGVLGVTPRQVDRVADDEGLDRIFPPVRASALALLLGVPPAEGSEPSMTPSPTSFPTSTPTGDPHESSPNGEGSNGEKANGEKAKPSTPPGHGPDNSGPPGHLGEPDVSVTEGPPESPGRHTSTPPSKQPRKPKQDKEQSTPRRTDQATPATTKNQGHTSGGGAGSLAPAAGRPR